MIEATINKILDHWQKVADKLLKELDLNTMATARDSVTMMELKSTQN